MEHSSVLAEAVAQAWEIRWYSNNERDAPSFAALSLRTRTSIVRESFNL